MTTKPFKDAHFATYPPDLIEPCVLAGCPEGGVVLDPYFGAGTTGLVAQQIGRKLIGCELNPDHVAIAENRLSHVEQKNVVPLRQPARELVPLFIPVDSPLWWAIAV